MQNFGPVSPNPTIFYIFQVQNQEVLKGIKYWKKYLEERKKYKE